MTSVVAAAPLLLLKSCDCLLGVDFYSFSSFPTVSVVIVQTAGGGKHRWGRGAETEDRAAPEGEEESVTGQQHDTPASFFQVCRSLPVVN